MLWILFSIATAFFDSLKNLFSKASLRNLDEYVVSWAFRLFTLLIIIPVVLFIGIPELGDLFWPALVVGGTLNSITTLMYITAFKHSDLSVTVPIVAFTPLFLLVTSPFIVGELPSTMGLFGILFIVIGSYLLNINHKKVGYLEPFKAILGERGPRLMLGVAFIWSITANVDKIGVQNSSSIFWVFAISAYVTGLLSILVLIKSRDEIPRIKGNLRGLVSIGLSTALLLIFQMTAINMALVSYVISIKRMTAVISVIFGYFFFKERNIRERLVGSSVMIIGVMLITLF